MMECNPLNLRGRRYLVTGASSGIGKATSILLSRLGAELVLVDLNVDGLKCTQSLCPNSTYLLDINLTDSGAIKQKISDMVVDFGKLNGFAHIAGRPYIAPLKGVSENVCTEVYKLNTYAAIELAKIFTNRKVYAGRAWFCCFDIFRVRGCGISCKCWLCDDKVGDNRDNEGFGDGVRF